MIYLWMAKTYFSSWRSVRREQLVFYRTGFLFFFRTIAFGRMPLFLATSVFYNVEGGTVTLNKFVCHILMLFNIFKSKSKPKVNENRAWILTDF